MNRLQVLWNKKNIENINSKLLIIIVEAIQRAEGKNSKQKGKKSLSKGK